MRAVIEAGVVLLIVWLFLRFEQSNAGLNLSATGLPGSPSNPCGGTSFLENPGDSSGAWEGSCLPNFGAPGGPGGAGGSASSACCCGGGNAPAVQTFLPAPLAPVHFTAWEG